MKINMDMLAAKPFDHRTLKECKCQNKMPEIALMMTAIMYRTKYLNRDVPSPGSPRPF